MSEKTFKKQFPIVEVLLDIKVELPPEITLNDLSLFQEDIVEQYPQKKERKVFKSYFEIKNGQAKVKKPKENTDGFLFMSGDGKRIVQSRLDGFTFNKLKPYRNWEDFKTEAKKLWSHYLKIAKPIRIKKIELRHINQINFPLPFSDFSEYLNTRIEVAEGLPQGVSECFTKLVIPFQESNICAIIVQAMGAKTQNDSFPFIFDIDVFCDTEISPEDEQVWEIIDDMKINKANVIFNKSITKKTEELF